MASSERSEVRDLLALSMIPEAWVGREPPAIAADLADLLIGSLELDFAFVRLCNPTGSPAVEVIRGDCWKGFPEWLQQRLAAFGQISRTEIVTNVGGVEKSCCAVVIPIGVNSERGLIAVACDRSDFPDQIDQQLLSVAANNAATAFQNALLINELRIAQKALRDQGQELRKARDELEIKVAERTSELRKSEKELRDVIDTIPAIVWSTLPDGSNTYVNKRFVEYSGSSAEQMAGSGWQALIHPDDLARHTAEWMEAVATGKPHENEVRSRRSDGQYRWQLDRGVPLRDEDGNIVKWYGITTDIEDRKRADEALHLVSTDLQDSKAKLEEAQRIAHVGYWEWDLTSNRVIWSDETYRIYGLRPQEYPIDIAVLRKMIHPEDSEFVFRVAEEAVRGGLRTDVEHRIIRPSGELRTVHSQGDVKKDASGRPCQMFGTVQDITDRKRAEDKIREQEAELRQIVDLAPQLVTVFGPNRERLYANRILLDYLGISLDEWRQRPDSIEFLHPDDRERVHAHSDRALSSGAPYELEFRVRKSSGNYRWFLTRFSPVRDDKGQIMRWYVAATDIEDRKRAEEALQQSQFYLAEGQRLAHMGSWAFNPSGFFDYWSEELFKIYGLDPGGKPPTVDEYLALVHPEDRAFMKQGIARMLDDHLAFDFTKRIVRPDGEIRHVRCVGVPVTQEGIFQGFLGTGMDVTEHELLTQELRRREAYLAEAQRLSQTGSFGWRPDSGEVVWSDETYRIFEYDHTVKPTIDLVEQRVHPEDRPDFLKVIESASAGATQFEHTYRLLLPDGSVKHVHALAHALQDSSGNREFVGAVTDVTSIKRAEEELRTSEAYLAEAQRLSQTGSWAWNPDQDIRYWSEECYRVLSFDPQDGLPRFDDFFQRLHPDDRPGFRELIQTAIREKAEWEADYRIVHPDGPIRDIHVVGHPVVSTSGHLVEFVGTVIDVTE
ncbi:MAG TPA: PAS domain-containing protein, partial [Candidatus Acidoferrum sp.]|nr:PAS domain-containing protein [Candidatus Acidoferrum sp.]